MRSFVEWSLPSGKQRFRTALQQFFSSALNRLQSKSAAKNEDETTPSANDLSAVLPACLRARFDNSLKSIAHKMF
jgi:hypothetical protein